MTDTSFIFRDVIQYKLQKLFCQMNFIHDKRRKKEKGNGKATAFLFLFSLPPTATAAAMAGTTAHATEAAAKA
ncbi:MAG: hypothetical protein Q3X99_05280, partial [Faecalibacterium sp.]|nr:hypothetical protein [Faecalibacterium sp.]